MNTPADVSLVGGTGRVLIVFCHNTEIKWLRILKAGFRHCFALLQQGEDWVLYNPMSHRTDVILYHQLKAEHLIRSFRMRGYRVLDSRQVDTPKEPAPWRFFSCVEAVKRVLGIQAPDVLTPWQFYRHLIKISKK